LCGSIAFRSVVFFLPPGLGPTKITNALLEPSQFSGHRASKGLFSRAMTSKRWDIVFSLSIRSSFRVGKSKELEFMPHGKDARYMKMNICAEGIVSTVSLNLDEDRVLFLDPSTPLWAF
jgi:hypothetical protein